MYEKNVYGCTGTVACIKIVSKSYDTRKKGEAVAGEYQILTPMFGKAKKTDGKRNENFAIEKHTCSMSKM